MRLAIVGGLALAAAACGGPSRPPLPRSLPPGTYDARAEAPVAVGAASRPDLLRRTRVRRDPPPAVERFDFARDRGDPPLGEDASCRFLPQNPGGTTPKFDCVLSDGEVLKVKYGDATEIAAGVAGSRLVTAFGFGADDVALVRTLRCFGCPREPFEVTQALHKLGLLHQYARTLDDASYVDFQWVAAQRRHPGRTIVAGSRGWAWYELDAIDERSGGATRAEVDALRLLAVFLAHWDNKAPNQRLVCPEGDADPSHCASPFAVIQDLGATFGPLKVDLPQWKATPVWADPRGCRVSMKELPWGGGTFTDVEISEGGRALLAGLLGRLSRGQVEGLFTAARFPQTAVPLHSPHTVREWADAFEARAREIGSRRCGVPDEATPRSPTGPP